MAAIRPSGTKNEWFKFPDLMLDEFVPVVLFDRTKFDPAIGFLSADLEISLSEYIDTNLQRYEPLIVETEGRIIKLPFKVVRGSEKSADSDGIIDIKITPTTPDVKLIGAKSINAKYNSSFEVDIEITKDADVEIYIDFYSKDDTDDEYNIGELSNVHCGRTKVQFNYTVTTNWALVAPVIPNSKFIGWNHPGVNQNCFNYALEQLRQVKHWVKSERWNKKWDGSKELNDGIYQLFLETDVAGMKKGVQKDQFEKGVEYLKKTLKSGIPVMVGVDDGSTLSNEDLTTEHFITIVGMGEDLTGKFFLFYDNAVSDMDIGTSNEKKLYCKPSKFLIEGIGDVRNEYIQGSVKANYIITQIRETK